MPTENLFYTDMSVDIVQSGNFKENYIQLLKSQYPESNKTDLDEDQIISLLKIASIFCFSNEKFKHLAYKIAAIIAEQYGEKYNYISQSVQYLMISSGQLPVVNKIIGDGHDDYFSLYSESSIPFNPVSFRDVIFKQANNSLDLGDNHEKKYFTDFQRTTFNDLLAGKSVSISAPTSAGKSFLLIAFLAKKIKENHEINVVYLVPSRALITQVQKDIRQEFKSFNIADIWIGSTSKVHSKNKNIPRKIFVLTQERFHNLLFDGEFNEEINILIVDEAQKVSDESRGILLEEVVEEAVKRNESLQTVFISPFSKNPEKFSHIFQLADVKTEKTILSPVSQNILKLDVTKKKYSLKLSTTKIESPYDILIDDGEIVPSDFSEIRCKDWQIIWALKKFGSESNIIYCNSPKLTVDLATALSATLTENECNSRITELIKFLKENIHPDYFLIDCLKKRIGFHHGSMPNQVRILVEELFKEKHLIYLFCTSTLLEGVNLPAQNIFIMKPNQGKGNHLDRLSFWNLAGRAGRLLKDYYGNIYCINTEEWKGYSPDPEDVEHEIESILENVVQEKDQSWIKNLKKLYIDFKLENKPREQAVTKFLIQSLKEGENNFVTELMKRNPTLDADSLKLLKSEIDKIALDIEIPGEIIQKNSMVNPLRQQVLLEYFRQHDDIGLPLHPNNRNFYTNLSKMIKDVNVFFLDKDDQSYKYFTLLITKWIHNPSTFVLIQGQSAYSKKGTLTSKMVNNEIV
ncbi:MAG: DEAD/DEAH box helicase, partial [Methanobacterium sp.]